jgi:hypothetical protein
VPPAPVSVTSRTALRERAAQTAATSWARPISGVAGTGRAVRRGADVAGTVAGRIAAGLAS